MQLSIIIVNWNSTEYLRKCLASILAETHGLEFEIVVIDSASYDGCGEMLRDEFSQVRFLQSQTNLGFARANNLAFQYSRGECVLFLNPDTELIGPAINCMYERLRTLPKVGVVGCRLLNSDRTIQTSCIQAFPTILNKLFDAEALRRITPRSRLWGMEALFDNSKTPAEVDMVSGACLMMRRPVFQELGGFSTDYFMYAEDVDLCYKSRTAGFKNYYCSEAVVVHHGGKSSGQARSNFSTVLMIESIRLFLRKSRGRTYSRCYRLALVGSALIRMMLLVGLSPVWVAVSGGPRWRAACSKWSAVFCWGLGVVQWPSQQGIAEDGAMEQSLTS